MYNLILVDDEPIVINGIQSVFNLPEYNFNLVGAYTNPLTALKEIPDKNPHLIITDVRMPQMDGLEFSREIKEISPSTEIVILSGHDDFSYAQAAVRIGASDYLLKPIKKIDFEKMLRSMEERISKKIAETHEREQLDYITKTNYSILRNSFFVKLLNNMNLDNPEILRLYQQLGFTFADSAFMLVKFVIFEIDVNDDYMSTFEMIVSEVSKIIAPYGHFEAFFTDEYLTFLVYDFNDRKTGYAKLYVTLTHYKAQKAEQSIRLLMGISQIHEHINRLFIAVGECDQYILANHQSSFSDIEYLHIPYTDIENLFTAISNHDESQINDIIDNIFNISASTPYKSYSYSLALMILLRLGHLHNKYQPENIFLTPEILDMGYLKQQYPSLRQLISFIKTTSMAVSGLIKNQETYTPSKVIVTAVDYIEEHYNEHLSLSDVAEHIHISKNYLCDLFRKEMNITFIDYVTSIRLEKAKYLLTHTDKKMYEISLEVGYNDYAYFSQIFKRHTGTTLSHYRKNY